MNKYQEALDELCTCTEGWNSEHCCSHAEWRQASEYLENCRKLLQELVDRATPKKVLNMYMFVYMNEYTVKTGQCPFCKRGLGINEVTKSPKFCPDCGQALEWTDADAK
jgi:hypothetical protein